MTGNGQDARFRNERHDNGAPMIGIVLVLGGEPFEEEEAGQLRVVVCKLLNMMAGWSYKIQR